MDSQGPDRRFGASSLVFGGDVYRYLFLTCFSETIIVPVYGGQRVVRVAMTGRRLCQWLGRTQSFQLALWVLL